MSEVLGKSWRRRLLGPALIVLAALLATAPQMLRGVSCGHDFDFHLVSWLDTVQNWREGILYPHWASSPNFGAGEPRFEFYPPLTWMLGAVLGVILPWRAVEGAMTVLLFVGTGLATRALAGQRFGDGPSTLAGCTAIFSGYTLFTAYERSAFAEMTGGIWFPLMLLLMLRADCGKGAAEGGTPLAFRDRIFGAPALGLALVVAGAWLSNAPVGVMISYLLAAAALVLAGFSRSWIPVLRAAIAAGLGLGLAAFYLVPAAVEQRWVAIRQAVDDPGLLIENSWLFARHADPRLELHDVELIRVSFIGASMIAVALVCLAVSWFRGTLPRDRSWWIPLALIPPVVFLLQLPVSEPVWNLLPKMRFLQFPWRWLVVLEAPMAVFFAAAVWSPVRGRRTAVITVCAVFFAAATVVAGLTLFQECDSEDSVWGMLLEYDAGTGFTGTDEYAPPGADNSLVATGLPGACLVSDPTSTLGQGDADLTPDWSPEQHSCQATFPISPIAGKTPLEHLRIHAQIAHDGYLVLRLRNYPAWSVTVNGRPASARPPRQDGLMAVAVPHGPVDLSVDWTTTRDVLVGRCISLAALFLITGLGAWQYRRIRPRLSS